MDDLYVPGEDLPKDNYEKGGNFVFKKDYLLLFAVFIIGVFSITSFFLFSKSTTTTKIASNPPGPQNGSEENQNINPSVTETKLVDGKISCEPNPNNINDCAVILKDNNNNVYAVNNLTASDLIKKKISKNTNIQAKITSQNNSSGQTVIVIEINGVAIPTPTPSEKQADTPAVSAIPTATPTPTPTPTITPTPSPTPIPPNISDIVDKGPILDGQIVTISGFVVSGNIGEEACIYIGLCDHSEVTVNDNASYYRDTKYDTQVIIRSSEKEVDYPIGSQIIMQVKVVNNSGVITFQKVY